MNSLGTIIATALVTLGVSAALVLFRLYLGAQEKIAGLGKALEIARAAARASETVRLEERQRAQKVARYWVERQKQERADLYKLVEKATTDGIPSPAMRTAFMDHLDGVFGVSPPEAGPDPGGHGSTVQPVSPALPPDGGQGDAGGVS